jgi:hypothetical protein
MRLAFLGRLTEVSNNPLNLPAMRRDNYAAFAEKIVFDREQHLGAVPPTIKAEVEALETLAAELEATLSQVEWLLATAKVEVSA